MLSTLPPVPPLSPSATSPFGAVAADSTDTAGATGTADATGTRQQAARSAGTAGAARTPGAADATRLTRGDARTSSGTGRPRAAGTTSPAIAVQPGVASRSAQPTGSSGRRGRPTDAAVTAVAGPPTAIPADPAGCTRSAGSATAAIAEQSGRSPSAAGHPGLGRGIAGAAIAVQKPASATIGVGRCPVGAVADQRAPQQCLCGRIDRAQHALLQYLQRRSIGRFRARVRHTSRGQRARKVVLKGRGLRAERLILPAEVAEQRRDGHRHFVVSGG
ncbi:hypothetical protein LRC537489_34330 [Mycobacterium riyadhense]